MYIVHGVKGLHLGALEKGLKCHDYNVFFLLNIFSDSKFIKRFYFNTGKLKVYHKTITSRPNAQGWGGGGGEG